MIKKDDQIKELLRFMVPRIKDIQKMESPFDLFLFCSNIVDDWEHYRKNEEVVELFYDTLEFMNIEVPEEMRLEELSWKLLLRIFTSDSPQKSQSFVDLAEQLGINKDTLKKMLIKVDPERGKNLRNRKKLTVAEHREIIKILGIYKDIPLSQKEKMLLSKSNFFTRRVIYELLDTDKKTLESNIPLNLKQKISGLDKIPPVLYEEIRDIIT